MANTGILTKLLAGGGTVLVWFPLVAPLALSAAVLVGARRFLLDYLMPAELFPVAILGGVLLFWAALRARSNRRLIGWALAVAVVMLVGSQALAVATGLASGETKPGGWEMAAVLAALAVYSAMLAVMGVGGVRLLRGLFKWAAPPGPSDPIP